MAHKPEVKIYRDMVLGIGCYGKVVMAAYGELPCAAKILHSTFFRFNDPAGEQNIVQKFRDECDLLSTIQHPNIVKYLRTVRNHKSQRPALLLELMHESLTKLLERSNCPLSNLSQLNITLDVANALAYLHSKSIVHRDLSSNNILLTADGTAKVTDFGMSKLIDMNTRATPLTLCPGTTVYMPPEAQITPPKYTDKLDCFSFGVLAIQTATRQFPNPSDGSKYVDDPRYSGGRVIVQIAEIERRKNHIDLIEPGHPLLPLIRECLKDRDTERPSAHKLCGQIFLLKEIERIQVETEKHDSEVEKGTNQCSKPSFRKDLPPSRPLHGYHPNGPSRGPSGQNNPPPLPPRGNNHLNNQPSKTESPSPTSSLPRNRIRNFPVMLRGTPPPPPSRALPAPPGPSGNSRRNTPAQSRSLGSNGRGGRGGPPPPPARYTKRGGPPPPPGRAPLTLGRRDLPPGDGRGSKSPERDSDPFKSRRASRGPKTYPSHVMKRNKGGGRKRPAPPGPAGSRPPPPPPARDAPPPPPPLPHRRHQSRSVRGNMYHLHSVLPPSLPRCRAPPSQPQSVSSTRATSDSPVTRGIRFFSGLPPPLPRCQAPLSQPQSVSSTSYRATSDSPVTRGIRFFSGTVL